METPEQYYRIPNWGAGYFKVNKKGHLCVYPTKNPDVFLDIYDFVRGEFKKGNRPPFSLHFPQMLEYSIRKISQSFGNAAREFDYKGSYRPVYPIKANQSHSVVSSVIKGGFRYGVGLEAGSKPELAAILSVVHEDGLIVCNGYKDEEYISMILEAAQKVKDIFVVIEKFSEIHLLYRVIRKFKPGKLPHIGIRARLNTKGSGKWEESGGDFAKFGLTAVEIVEAVDFFEKHDLVKAVRMLHVHIGSQITNTSRIKEMVYEAGYLFCELKRMNVPVKVLDFGGGLAIDYDGSRTSAASSSNYTLTAYANNILFHLKEVCDKQEINTPDVFTESGRAISAYHSMVIVNAFDKTAVYNPTSSVDCDISDNQLLQDLTDTLENLSSRNLHEYFLDAVHMKQQLHTLFKIGMMSLKEKAYGEQIFWNIVKKTTTIMRHLDDKPEGFENIDNMLASKYICNFSIFQSIPDSWAIKQLFPMSPIHRLNEIPQETATMADITCDSDGKIEKFVDLSRVRKSIKLHRQNGDPYFIGIFLTGAYQQALRNDHNLFGEPMEYWIDVDGKDSYSIISEKDAVTVGEMIRFNGYSPEKLEEKYKESKVVQDILGTSTYLKYSRVGELKEKPEETIVEFIIQHLSCTRCVQDLEDILSELPIITSINFNKKTGHLKLTILGEAVEEEIEKLLELNGFNPEKP